MEEKENATKGGKIRRDLFRPDCGLVYQGRRFWMKRKKDKWKILRKFWMITMRIREHCWVTTWCKKPKKIVFGNKTVTSNEQAEVSRGQSPPELHFKRKRKTWYLPSHWRIQFWHHYRWFKPIFEAKTVKKRGNTCDIFCHALILWIFW